jgi:flagellar hook-associated protein 2
MAGTVSFPSIGSTIDVQSIIDAYVNAESVNQNQMKQRATNLQSASTSISNISSSLSSLSTALSALTDARDVQSYAVTSSGTDVAASITGSVQPGSYSVEVVDTAKEYRAYSATNATSATDPANISGVLQIAVGKAGPASVTIGASDSLNDIVGKINSSGLNVAASTFYDGSNYRIQLRGLDTGKDNQVTLSGLDLGFGDTGNLIQQANDAHVKVDGQDVYSSSNQINGAISGVTLAVSAKTTSPQTVSVKADAQGLADKVQAMVTAYNAVISKVHTTAGYGSAGASVASLSGDSTLRSLTDSLSSSLLGTVSTGTNYQTLGSLGINLQKDGTLSVDSAKLTKAITSDSASVISVLAGAGTGKGVMDMMSSVAKSFDEAGSGVLAKKVETLTSQAKVWNNNIDSEQTRIDNYTAMLQKQFTAMTTSISASKSMGDYLNSVFGTTSSSTSTSKASSG